ncbi:MAG: hypothetical protein N3B13_09780 [Deltaproteobacteria bacterium]|nr:hypothetical protein [Deltaproteobacteria bacterium]
MIIHRDSGLKDYLLFRVSALRLSFSVFVLFFLVSCQPELEQPYEIKKLRILGVKANHPQISVTIEGNVPVFYPESVQFSVLAADPDSFCRDINFPVSYSVCIPQQYNDDSSYSLDCEGENGIEIKGNTLEPLMFFAELLKRYKEIGQVNMPVDVVIKGDKFRLPIPVMAKVSNSKEETTAVKFVEFVSYKRDNRNPKIQKILINDVDVTANGYNFALISGRKYRITPVIDKKSLDKIYYEVDGKYEDEGIQFSFFSQKGEFDKVATSDKYPDVIYTLSSSDKEDFTAIYIVARDFRGGIDWVAMNCIRVLPDNKE